MATFKVSPEKYPNLFRENEQARLERVVKAIQTTVKSAGPTIATLLTRHGTARLRAPIDTSNYIRSWKAEDLDGGAVLFNDAPYAMIIERGRRPGARMPPKAVIAEWLEHKMRGTIKGRKDRAKQAARLAFVVARAIARRGLPAHRIMAKARVKLDPMVREAIRDALNGEDFTNA